MTEVTFAFYVDEPNVVTYAEPIQLEHLPKDCMLSLAAKFPGQALDKPVYIQLPEESSVKAAVHIINQLCNGAHDVSSSGKQQVIDLLDYFGIEEYTISAGKHIDLTTCIVNFITEHALPWNDNKNGTITFPYEYHGCEYENVFYVDSKLKYRITRKIKEYGSGYVPVWHTSENGNNILTNVIPKHPQAITHIRTNKWYTRSWSCIYHFAKDNVVPDIKKELLSSKRKTLRYIIDTATIPVILSDENRRELVDHIDLWLRSRDYDYVTTAPKSQPDTQLILYISPSKSILQRVTNYFWPFTY